MRSERAEEMRVAARAYLDRFDGGAVRMRKDPTRGVAIITLDRPEKRNAISGRMMVELHDHVRALEDWAEGKACVLHGAGGNFSSGGDLDFAQASGTPDGASLMNFWMNDTLNRLGALKLFSVAVVDGPTLGGGAEIAVACDFVLAAESVKFGVVHGKLGIVTAWGGGTRLTRRIGPLKALDLLLTSKILSAQECFHIGLVDAIIHNDGDVDTWLETRLQHHHTVIRAMKQIALHARHLPIEAALERERGIFLPFWGGELNKQALQNRTKQVPNDKNELNTPESNKNVVTQ